MAGRIIKYLPKSTRTKINFYRDDMKDSKGIPLSIKMKMWKKGFKAKMYYYYKLDSNNSSIYVSDLFNELTHPKNGIYTNLLDNKLYLPYCLKDFPDQAPTYRYLVQGGKILELDEEFRKYDISFENFKMIFGSKKNQKVIGKRIGGSGGGGAHIMERKDENTILINNTPFPIEKGYEIFRGFDRMVITDFIEQHPYAAELNPTTVNSIRIVTAWDPLNNEPYIMYGIQKIGRSFMFGPDNGALGGFTGRIDMETGELTKIAILGQKSVTYLDNHPDSNIRIPGRKIPHFDSLKDTLLKICWNLNFIKHIGWDIVVTEDSFKVLEMNSNPDHYGPQLFHKILEDKRNIRFFSQFVNKQNEKYFMK